MRYQEFEARIQARTGGGFEVAARSPYGPATSRFKPPFPRRQLLKLPADFEELHHGVSGGTCPSPEEIGRKLFDSLFAGDVGDRFRQSLAHLESHRDEGLRIRLSFDLDDPRVLPLAALPWELLQDARRDDFLSRLRQTPICRYLPVDRPPLEPLEGPLRILVVEAAPADLNALNLAAEWRAIWGAVHSHPEIEVSSIVHPSLGGLRQKLLEETWHVLHFMGHGNFDRRTGEGVLFFEDGAGNCDEVPARVLGDHLKSVPDLRLVFLNACRTGAMPLRRGQDPFKATAAALLRAGVPAVIANQTAVSDGAAIAFSAHVYAGIATSEPIDAAAVEGRLAILREGPVDWAIPVIFTRLADGDVLGRRERAARPSAPARSRLAVRETGPLRLGIRSFSDTGHSIIWGEEMAEECKEVLDFRPLFGGKDGRHILDPAWWQTRIAGDLRDFLARAASTRRPLHLNFAAHSSIAFAAGYFLDAKSGLDVTIRQRSQAGIFEWRALAAEETKGLLLCREKALPGTAKAKDVALALGITWPVVRDVETYVAQSGLAVRRIVPVTLAPKPSQRGVRDGSHALRLAQIVVAKLEERTERERGAVLHLFASAPNALLFFLGQLARGLGRIQLYEHDFGSGRPGAYCPSILIPPSDQARGTK